MERGINTRCLHLEETEGKTEHYGSLSYPIYQTATYAHVGVGKSTGYDYSRLQNPTREHLEKVVASLEGGIDAFALSSGMAAITLLMEIFEPGDHIIAEEDLYGGSIRLFDNVSKKNHYEFTSLNCSKDDIEGAIRENTKAIYIETPTNPMMNVSDISRISEIARKHGLLLIVDNTFLSPYFQNPLKLGADIVIHSASDDLASGQSTFMVEMTEVANILRNATKNSLLVLDEIGRGTSTFDGLSIAWAVIEHISNPKILGAKTLFATHYHELTELEGTISGVNNYCIAVKEQGDDIVFLRKIVKGGADKSYGIQVAKLAGVPEPVIARAKELVEELASADITAQAKEIAQMSASPQHKAVAKPDEVDLNQMSIFDTVKDDDIIKELGDLELSSMTPIDALNTLYRLQTKLKNRWQ